MSNTEQRKQEIIETLSPIWREDNETMYQIAKRQINKLAKSSFEMDTIKKLLNVTLEFGLNAPLYALGLEKMSNKGWKWMANISVGRFEVDTEEAIKNIKTAAGII